MNPLHSLIQDEICCAPADVARLENIMRDDVFHSPLDWQSRAQLQQGARQAWQLLQENRALYEKFERDLALPVLAGRAGEQR